MKNIIEYRNSLRNSDSFKPHEIVEKYKVFVAQNTTFRFLCPEPNQIKTFGLRNRVGIHEAGNTPREEEKICQAIFNTFKPEKDNNSNITLSNSLWEIPQYSQYIIDYQTPLKNSEVDNLWGKIDLIGLIQGSPKKHLCFWEMKYGQNKDSLHFAIMELLIYYAQFDLINAHNDNVKKNYHNFLFEASLVRGANLTNNIVTVRHTTLPVLFIAADKTYFDNCNWNSKKTEYLKLKQIIEEELKVKLEFLQIDTDCDHNNNRFYYRKGNTLKFLQ